MSEVLLERAEGVATLTLNRPAKKNAVTPAMWAGLLKGLQEIAVDPTVRAVVLTGAGDAFCSGADLWGGAGDDGTPRQHRLMWMEQMNDVCRALFRVPQPVIAKVRGAAVGAGCNLALACERGLSPDFAGSWLVPRLVGLQKAKELMYFADILTAADAERYGLVNKVVAADQLDDVVAEWAQRLAAGPPIAMALTKRLLNDSFAKSLDQALSDEAAAQSLNFSTKDTAEALAAFTEKREPRFTGR
jgi:2-(1,2-epoxy-1,2-dihydrophenyl)acetyl-CoA isomerase